MPRLSAAAPLAVALALGALPRIAWSQMYRCVDKEGHQHYSQTIPNSCIGRPIEQLSPDGIVIRRILPPPTAAQQRAAKAAAEKAKERAEVELAQQHRDQALLATYTSLKDIENARAQALASNKREVTAIDERVAALEKRRKQQKARLRSYGAGKAPQMLQLDIKNTESDLAMQRQLLTAKKEEAERINASFDSDAKRYAKLTGQAYPAGR